MRVSSLLVSLAALAGSVVGDANTIRNTMRTIGRDTAALGATVSAWSGSVLDTLPIVSQSSKLLLALAHGSHTAKVSTPLSFDEALSVASATGELAKTVNATLEAIIAARPKFDAVFVSPLILVSLGVQRRAASDFSAKVVDKVPKDLQPVAVQLVKGIDDSFIKAEDAFYGHF